MVWLPAASNGTTGRVVSRNSPRSFVKPRSATTETGNADENVNVPNTESLPLKGG